MLALVLFFLIVTAAQQPLAAFSDTPAHGHKVIGVVFDDSGSMGPRIQLPAFAAQLLVSSLDPMRDKLFTVKLSSWEAVADRPDVRAFIRSVADVGPETMQRLRSMHIAGLPTAEFAAGRRLDEIVEAIRKDWWKSPRVWTPYTPIELMLQTLVDETGPDDEAHLVIITDGAIDGPQNKPNYIPDIAMVERNLAAYRGHLRGPLFVEFVLIASPEDDESGTVAKQGIRRALTGAFNGTPDAPGYIVANSEGLMRAMYNVIARINATDRTLPPNGPSIIQVSDRRLTIESPLSISAIVSVTFAPTSREPARIVASSFGRQPTSLVKSFMLAADTQKGWQGEKNSAWTEQFRFSEPLSPGISTIDFDNPIGQQYLFLFDTLARFDVEIRDDKGNSLALGPANLPTAVVGQQVQVVASLKDTVNGIDRDVDLAKIGDATATAWIEGKRGRTAVEMRRDAASNRFVGAFTPQDVGSYAAGGSLVISGFVRREAHRPTFEAIDGAVAPKMTLSAVNCTACKSGELATRWTPGDKSDAIGELRIQMPAGKHVPFVLDLAGSPPWIGLTEPGGSPVEPGKPLSVGDDGGLQLLVVRTPGPPEEPRDYDRTVSVRLRAIAPYVGETTSAARLHIEVPQPRLVYVGHSGAQDGNPLTLSLSALAGGHEELRFELQGLLGQPLQPSEVTVTTRSWTASFPVTLDGPKITVRPVTANSWSQCLACLFGIPTEVTVRYRGIGEATSVAPLRFAASLREILLICGPWLLAALIAIWLFLALLVFIRTPRFPHGSVALIRRKYATTDAAAALRNWDAEGNWRTVLGALFLRSLPARTHVEGLYLEASNAGVRLLLRGTTETIKILSQNKTVRAIREDRKSVDFMPLAWNSTFAEPPNFEQLVLSRGVKSADMRH